MKGGAVVALGAGFLLFAFMAVPGTSQSSFIPIGEKAGPVTADIAGDGFGDGKMPGTLTPAWDKIPAKYRAAFFSAAKTSGCAMATPWLLAALVEKETGFKNAVSSAGARGWTQIMPNSEKSGNISHADVLDPNKAIPAAAVILCKKEAATRSNPSSPVVRALAAYNGGEGNVKASGMPGQIKKYANDVIAASAKYKVNLPEAAAITAPVTGGGLPKNAGTTAGIVALGHVLKARGVRVGEGPPPFGPVFPVHAPNSYHKRDLALDLNYDGKTTSESAYFDVLAPQLVAAGWRVIWRQKGHFDHLHVDAGPGGMLKL